MTNLLHNIGYFFREAKTIVRLNLLSNMVSLISTGLIFFILAMVVAGWWISIDVIEVIQGEAEINVYFDESLNAADLQDLIKGIGSIEGVREVRLVDEKEAYARMEEILGEEARVLEFFEDNPFNPFIEVKIHLEQITSILEKLTSTQDVAYVRDNQEILERLRSLSRVLEFSGYLAVVAVGISTLVIVSHMIRLEIYNNREQINTLRLLGAPESFIGLPFLIVGILLTLSGGLVAASMSHLVLNQIYAQMAGPLPFIPLPPFAAFARKLAALIILLSIGLGLTGSLVGLSSEKGN